MVEKKLTWKQLVLVASLIFGMFFGAGNLIFPIQLGQLSGGNWLPGDNWILDYRNGRAVFGDDGGELNKQSKRL
jgi:hypothetical protein